MNWRLIFLLSLLGVLESLISTLGWLPQDWMETAAWVAIAVASALVLASRGSGTFASGFMLGLMMAIWQHLLIFLLWDTYTANNPEFAAQMARDNPLKGVEPQVAMLVMLPLIGAMFGLFTGLLTWLAGRMLRRKPLPLEP